MSFRRIQSRPSGRRAPLSRSQRASQHLLDVRVRRSTASRQRKRKFVGFVLRVALCVSVVAATYFGFVAITDKFFLKNPEYNLSHVEIDADGVLTAEEILEITRIELGTNIFRIDLAKADAALREFEQIETVRIERDWPSRIIIQIRKRQPVAWLAAAQSQTIDTASAYLLDSAGKPIRAHHVEPEYWQLPVIFCPDVSAVIEGDPLAVADLAAAMGLLEELGMRPASLFNIKSLDITKGHSIMARDDRGAEFVFSPDDPSDQLDRLEKLLIHCRDTGRKLKSVKLSGGRFTPVEFAALAEEVNPGEAMESAEEVKR